MITITRAALTARLALAVVAVAGAWAMSTGPSAAATTGPAVLPTTTLAAVALDPQGRLYAADCFGARIFRFDPDGPVVVAGNGSQAYAGDGGPAVDASLYCPAGLAFDERGMFIVDHGNNRIRLVDASGVITTFAGTGATGPDHGAWEGDGGPAIDARFQEPTGIAIDASGVIVIGDRDNDVVRRIDSDGIVTTIAGTGVAGFGGDGEAATSAMLSSPGAVAIDALGNVDVADPGNDRVRRIGVDGIITTIAGDGTRASTGDGGPATEASLDAPAQGIVRDAAGNLYITEGQRIRRVDPAGTITTFTGTGEPGVSGDGGPAIDARLDHPAGLAIGADGTLYVSSDEATVPCIRAIRADGTIHAVWCRS